MGVWSFLSVGGHRRWWVRVVVSWVGGGNGVLVPVWSWVLVAEERKKKKVAGRGGERRRRQVVAVVGVGRKSCGKKEGRRKEKEKKEKRERGMGRAELG